MFAENILGFNVKKSLNLFKGNLVGLGSSMLNATTKVCSDYLITKYAAVVTLGITSGAVVYHQRDNINYFLTTRIVVPLETLVINTCSSPVMPDVRQRFKDENCLATMAHNTPRNHSHPAAATLRCKANTFMDHFSHCVGLTPFSVSMSRTQRTQAAAGSRYYYSVKDLQMSPSYSRPSDKHIITMTDVDYYVDLKRELRGHPVLLYTFVPLAPAGPTTEGVYCTHQDDTVETVINGGARYRHPCWDFDTDHLVVDHLFYSIFYLVEQIKVSVDRRIIFLNPIRKVYGPFARWLPGKRLTRRKFNHAEIAFTRYTQSEGDSTKCYYSIAKFGEFQSCTITSSTFSTAFIRTAECKEPNLGQVERVFNHAKVPFPLDSAALFFDAYKRAPQMFGKAPNIITPCVDQHTYQAVGPFVTEDGKTSMRAIWPGYCCNTFSPAKSFNNDKACIAGRIDEPRNKEPKLPPIYYTFFGEFSKFLVPDSSVETLAPLNHDEMAAKFNRPTQRALIEQIKTTMLMVDPKVKSFQKAEAYPKVVHPRNISTLPMDHNFSLGQFMYPFMEAILKTTHWYAFGKTPRQISYLLNAKAQHSKYAVPTDADKLDGSVRALLRDLFLTCLLRAYPREYHDRIRRLENKERHIRATTANGVSYDTGDTILSGSVITSVLGSTINAFLNYCALRHHYSPSDAYDALGVYGGDDGVTFDLPPNTLMRTVAKFGMSYKAEAIDKGNPVPFLGRIYLDPWTTNESICDVQRQFRKLHLTATPATVPNALVLHRKAIGILATDPETPLISEWAKAVEKLMPSSLTTTHRQYAATIVDQSYWAKYSTDVQFVPPTDKDYAIAIVCENLGVTPPEIERIESSFKTATKLEDLYKTNIIYTEMKVLIDAIVGREIVHAQPRKTIPEMVKEKAKLKVALCRFIAKKQECKFGDKCQFSHHLPKANAIPPKIPESGKATIKAKPTASPIKGVDKKNKVNDQQKIKATPPKSSGKIAPTKSDTPINSVKTDKVVLPSTSGTAKVGPLKNKSGKKKVTFSKTLVSNDQKGQTLGQYLKSTDSKLTPK